MATPPALETTSDGWTVIDHELFRYLIDHVPPRPSRFWRQLCLDARGRAPLFLWGFGLGLIAIGAYFRKWPIAVLGVLIWLTYLCIFLRFVMGLRQQVIYRGVIENLKPHPLFNHYAISDARLDNGKSISVAVDRNLVNGIMTSSRPAEVLFDYGPKFEYGWVIAARSA